MQRLRVVDGRYVSVDDSNRHTPVVVGPLVEDVHALVEMDESRLDLAMRELELLTRLCKAVRKVRAACSDARGERKAKIWTKKVFQIQGELSSLHWKIEAENRKTGEVYNERR